ncbi:MAG TPA: site-specific DNA-methyltransferase [Tepidisphaeraceae bacterium]|jgi:adenine-specific DNA-methyltransferase
MAREFRLKSTFAIENTATLAVKDALLFMKSLPDACTQLVVTSPPYNIQKTYEKRRRTILSYLREQSAIFAEAVRILKPGGSICWQVGHHLNGHGQIIPLDMLMYPVLRRYQRSGVYLRNRIIWHFEHGMHTTKRFAGRHEMLMWFTKGDAYKFELDRVRVPQKYPGKRAYRGPKKGELSGNPLGKNPGDVWVFPNVKGKHIEKSDHPCQFPIELVDRLVEALTDEGDLVVDPYVGVGTSVAAAILRRRRGAGCDIIASYIKIAKERAKQAHNGTLKYRPRTRPVYKPQPNTKLTSVPPEFCYVSHD